MKPHSHFSRITHHASRNRGVALVITVIMLSVILFMAITFLALSRREKGVVATTKDMTTSKFAADSALERAKGEILANILGTTNVSSFGLLVSTNFIRWEGFDPAAGNNMNWQAIFPPTVNGLTNVNFDYLENGNAPSLAQRLQNLTNLYFSPRAPVWVTNATRGVAGSYDFRYYLDLNRNGRHDRTGFWPVTNVDSSGNPVVATLPNGQWVSNYMVGDPEWIGVLERPGFPHSSTNKFLSRYAYMVVPAGKTLDVNYIHNEALGDLTVRPSGNDFSRNYGVGSWEINLAAFLADLNTNKLEGWGDYFYDLPPNFNPTTPTVNQSVVSRSGVAFQDAGAIYKFRMNGDAANRTHGLETVRSLYGLAGVQAFQRNGFDGYSDGDLRVTNSGVLPPNADPIARPWSGAYNTNHLFSAQDFFKDNVARAAKPLNGIPQRLSSLGTNLSTYDAYTYSRLLSQLGTDSAYEDTDKLNLNFVNVGGFAATNFIRWDNAAALGVPQSQVALVMFTNIANRLLSRYTQDWLDNDRGYYQNYFGTNQPFDATSIPVLLSSNRFVYTPAVNRLLQLAANICSTQIGASDRFPLIFRPLFKRDSSGIHITRYEQVTTNNPSSFLTAPIDVQSVPQSRSGLAINVYGVPWIIGAKKGLPNFNECAMHSVVQLTRKMQITRPVTLPGTWTTNLMYVMSVSNAIGVELWNSYRTPYTNPVLVRVTGDILMSLTNEYGVAKRFSVPLSNDYPVVAISNVTVWQGTVDPTHIRANSFIVPLRTNLMFLPESAYVLASRNFINKSNAIYETGQGFPEFKWGLNCAMRLRVIMQANGVNGPIIDYVQLDGLDVTRNITAEIAKRHSATTGIGLDAIENKVWDSKTSAWGMTVGMSNQIAISLGQVTTSSDWTEYGTSNPSDKQAAIASFTNFMTAKTVAVTDTKKQVPFTPTASRDLMLSWQANDPMVHYLTSDLLSVMPTNKNTLKNLQVLPQLGGENPVNDRYMPWGGNPNKPGNANDYELSVKDPLVASSDDWEFPTNALPNIGWLGRVHRGTPWQTVYLKASDVGLTNFPTPLISAFTWVTNNTYAKTAQKWSEWSGNPNRFDSFYTRPAEDRVLFDIFTTALNENATRGQLPINQEGLAAWSAVLGGVIAITNTSTLSDLQKQLPPRFGPRVIQPAGYFDRASTVNPLPALVKIVDGINATRTNTGLFQSQSFKHLGDVLAAPELSTASPFLDHGAINAGHNWQQERGLNDAAYEWIPQQIMSLLRVGEPRFVVYAYGQTLIPANSSIFVGGNLLNRLQAFNGVCTNYQVTAEIAARAVVRVEGSPDPTKTDTNLPPKLRYPPRLVVESYNVLGPD